MQNWIVNLNAEMLPNWRDAMPTAQAVDRRQAADLPAAPPGIVWFRLRFGEQPAAVLGNFRCGPEQHLVVLADEPSEQTVREVLSAGASGCCNTHAAPEVLRQVALVVTNNGLWVGQSLLQRLVGTTARILAQRGERKSGDTISSQLSEREQQVAELVAGGASNKEIARQLDITERTVKAHLTAIFEKTGVRDRLQLSLRINGLSF